MRPQCSCSNSSGSSPGRIAIFENPPCLRAPGSLLILSLMTRGTPVHIRAEDAAPSLKTRRRDTRLVPRASLLRLANQTRWFITSIDILMRVAIAGPSTTKRDRQLVAGLGARRDGRGDAVEFRISRRTRRPPRRLSSSRQRRTIRSRDLRSSTAVPTLAENDLALFLAAHDTKEGWRNRIWLRDFAELLRKNEISTGRWCSIERKLRVLPDHCYWPPCCQQHWWMHRLRQSCSIESIISLPRGVIAREALALARLRAHWRAPLRLCEGGHRVDHRW